MFRTDNRPKFFRTLALLCEDESLSDAQLKSYQTRLQEYRTYLDAVSRLANCGNVCITEEAVMIGDNGLLTGESLNALQHAGAISVYNTLQQNNWEFPLPEEGEVAVVKAHTNIHDEFLDLEKPVRSDWPAVHISECFVEGDKAKLHGSARPLRTFLPPSVLFRNAADVDDDIPEQDLPVSLSGCLEGGLEIISTANGLAIRKAKDRDTESECIPITEYFYGRQDCATAYIEENAQNRFKCAVCQGMFFSNVTLMDHIMGHVDEEIQALLSSSSISHCRICGTHFPNAFELRAHMDRDHVGVKLKAPDVSEGPGQRFGSGLLPACNDASFSCRICGKESSSDLSLAHHLQSTHRQREMPYVCRLCPFRSSLYEDILDHFRKAHSTSNHLLCVYCLRIFTPSDARVPGVPIMSAASASGGAVSTAGLGVGVGQTQVYLQHLRMHQIHHQLRRCPNCRLNFTNKSDYQVHKRLDHKACVGSLADHQEPRVDDYYMIENLDATPKVADASLISSESGVNKCEPSGEKQRIEAIHLQAKEAELLLVSAPEPSRIKDLSDTLLPPEATTMTCLECGGYLSSEEHKRYLPCSVCVFATCCSVGFTRHVRRTHIHDEGMIIDSHTGGPMIHSVAFEWMSESSSVISGENLSLTPSESIQTHKAEITTLSASTHLDGGSRNLPTIDLDEVANETLDLVSPDLESEPPTFKKRKLTEDSSESSKELSEYPDTNQQMNQPQLPIEKEPSCHRDAEKMLEGTLQDLNPKLVATDVIVSSGNREAIESTTVDTKDSLLGPIQLMTEESFACSKCAFAGVDGNSLTRHLIEHCGAENATLQPDPSLVSARLQAENQLREEQAAGLLYPPDNGLVITGDTQGMPTVENMVPDGVPNDAVSNQYIGTEGMTLIMHGGDEQLAAGTTVDITDDAGEVIQRLVIPDDLSLEIGQSLVLLHGEYGQPQFAVINQADWEANNQQLMIQSEDETNTLLLYGNAEGSEGVMEGEETQLA